MNKRLEVTALHRSGRVFPIELTITAPTRMGNGFFFGAFLRDISERRERDEQLRRAKESAEAATRAKSEFLANMSHELRTPLNGVLGYAQLLQRDPTITGRQREALDAIAKSGSHLLDVINEILDLSKIEAGRAAAEASATDLAQLASDLRQLMGEAAGRKQIGLRTSVADDVPRAVCLDGRHLRQVLLNLLGNAIKFTSAGEVHLTIERDGSEHLRFAVADTGIGIPPAALSTIFEAFTQTKDGVLAGGSGLGLTISRHLVALMGGELKVDSVPGHGSRFFFTLPLVHSDAVCEAPISTTRAVAGRLPRAWPDTDCPGGRRQHVESPHSGRAARERGHPVCARPAARKRSGWPANIIRTSCSWTSGCRTSTASRRRAGSGRTR